MTNIKKITLMILCIAMMLGSLSACSSCQNAFDPADTSVSGTDAETDLKEEDTTPDVLVGQFTDRTITDARAAIAAVKDASEKLGLTNATDELTVKSESVVENLTYYRLQQNYNGIPVYGNFFVVVSDEQGNAKGLTSQALDISDVNTTPAVTAEAVRTKLTHHFGTVIFPLELPDENLTIYCGEDAGTPVLAYELEVLVNGEKHMAVVDAQSGEVLKAFTTVNTADIKIPTVEDMLKDCVDVYDAEGKYLRQKILVYNDTQYLFLEDGQGELYFYSWDGRLFIYTKGDNAYNPNNKRVDISNWKEGKHIPKLYVLETVGNKWYNVLYTALDSMKEPQTVTQNEKANLLVKEIANAHGFFASLFGRKGYDDNNGQILAVFDEKYYDKNAASLDWDGKTIICIGTNMAITADLVAHEYTHSVEGSISNMDYEGQSGALMEAISDIFGELVEDMEKGGTLNGDCDWIHTTDRNIKNPSKTNNPGQFNGKNWYTGDNESKRVHTNSTVISHAGYLMTQSTTGGKALTMEELAKLWYHTLYTLPQSCSFNAFRRNMLLVAESLNYTQDQIKCITAAFDAVGVDGMDGWGNGATAWETYSNKDLTLQVYGKDMELYDDYTVDINSFTDKTQDTHIRVTNTKPVELKTKTGEALKPGTYTIVVANAQDTTQREKKNIRIVADTSADNTIYFSTTFEKVAETEPSADTQAPAQTEKPEEPTDTQEPMQTEKPENPVKPDFSGSQGLAFTSNGNGTCAVSGIGTCTDTNLVIPKYSPDGDLVICIGDAAFDYCSMLRTVNLGENIKSIGDYAFKHCYNLGDINIPDSVISIGNYAFSGCSKLTSISIPDSTTDIGEHAFAECSDVTSVTLGQGLINIGAYAFADCTSLESIVIPDNIVTIGDRAFQYCTKLTSVTFGKGVTTIGKGAFNLCDRLTGITIPGNVKKIGEDAFRSCIRLTDVVIGIGVEEIHPCAFFVSNNIADVYFMGTEDQWYDIEGVGQIKAFDDSTIHYNYTP